MGLCTQRQGMISRTPKKKENVAAYLPIAHLPYAFPICFQLLPLLFKKVARKPPRFAKDGPNVAPFDPGQVCDLFFGYIRCFTNNRETSTLKPEGYVHCRYPSWPDSFGNR